MIIHQAAVGKLIHKKQCVHDLCLRWRETALFMGHMREEGQKELNGFLGSGEEKKMVVKL